MASRIGWRLLVAFSLILVVSALRAQNVQPERSEVFLPQRETPSQINRPSAPVSAHLPVARWKPPLHFVPKMIQASGIIFSGRVIAVSRAAAQPGEQPSATVITFRVQHAIRGAVAGQNLEIREWPGLWSRGERYRVGEHVFLFLYPPSRLGLTSPVSGPWGRLAMDSQERILLRPEALNAFAPDLMFQTTAVPYSDFEQVLQRISNEK